jgi:hypothetical protein
MPFTAMEMMDSFDGVTGMVKSTKVETIPAGHGKTIHGICRPGVRHGFCHPKNKTK